MKKQIILMALLAGFAAGTTSLYAADTNQPASTEQKDAPAICVLHE